MQQKTVIYRGRQYYRHPAHGHIMKVVRGKLPGHEDWVLDQREWRPHILGMVQALL